MAEKIAYDEFAMFHENAEEYGIPYTPPAVRREGVDLGDGRRLSALVWGSAPPDLVFLHGGAQNAHTWDTVLLALGRPAVAVDLPGHGHSDGGRSGYLDPDDNADDVALAIRRLAPDAQAVIGMSLGGITSIALAHRHPDLVRRLVLVDITPGVNGEKSAQITAFVNGPESFPDFDAILARTVEFNPTRSVASLRRGILHNAEQRDDGSWVWRYARHRSGVGEAPGGDPHDRFKQLWDALGSVTVPVMLVRGMRPQSVVDDADEAELRRRQPDVRVEHVEEAGHSVQG
ncbi:MAG TPA: alpha/beta hydrolase, partial [Acidimicrobiales bacterium]|nr:alpha/beta hydrolase [Acidimicrobiales bacterium]